MPYNYTSISEIDSTICPGVKYALNRMTENRRVKLRLMLADGRAKMNDVMRQIEEIRKQPEEMNAISPGASGSFPNRWLNWWETCWTWAGSRPVWR